MPTLLERNDSYRRQYAAQRIACSHCREIASLIGWNGTASHAINPLILRDMICSARGAGADWKPIISRFIVQLRNLLEPLEPSILESLDSSQSSTKHRCTITAEAGQKPLSEHAAVVARDQTISRKFSSIKELNENVRSDEPATSFVPELEERVCMRQGGVIEIYNDDPTIHGVTVRECNVGDTEYSRILRRHPNLLPGRVSIYRRYSEGITKIQYMELPGKSIPWAGPPPIAVVQTRSCSIPL